MAQHADDVRAQLQDERRRRYRRGHLAEWIACGILLARGHRILGRRVRTPVGEIDLIAVRGRRIVFVEVKRRATRAEAEAALNMRQSRRLVRAAEHWMARHPRYRDYDWGFDAVLVLSRRLPVYLRDAVQPQGGAFA